MFKTKSHSYLYSPISLKHLRVNSYIFVCFPSSCENGQWETNVVILWGLIQFQLSGDEKGNGYSSSSFSKF